jgi:hypothetical protein
MTSTQAVRLAKIGAEFEKARKAGDLGRMQSLISQETRLLQSVYGTLAPT